MTGHICHVEGQCDVLLLVSGRREDETVDTFLIFCHSCLVEFGFLEDDLIVFGIKRLDGNVLADHIVNPLVEKGICLNIQLGETVEKIQSDFLAIFALSLTKEHVFQRAILIIEPGGIVIPVFVERHDRIYSRKAGFFIARPLQGSLRNPVCPIVCQNDSVGRYSSFAEKCDPVSFLQKIRSGLTSCGGREVRTDVSGNQKRMSGQLWRMVVPAAGYQTQQDKEVVADFHSFIFFSREFNSSLNERDYRFIV